MKYIILILVLSILPLYSKPVKVVTKLVTSAKKMDLPEGMQELVDIKGVGIISLPGIVIADPKVSSVDLNEEKVIHKNFKSERTGVTYSLSLTDKGEELSYVIKLVLNTQVDGGKEEAQVKKFQSKTYYISGVAKKDKPVWIPLGDIHFETNHKEPLGSYLYKQGGTSKLLVRFVDSK